MDHSEELSVNVPEVAPMPVTLNRLSNSLEVVSLSMRPQPAARITSALFAFRSLGSLPYVRHEPAVGSVVSVNSRSVVIEEPGQFTDTGAASEETGTRNKPRTRRMRSFRTGN